MASAYIARVERGGSVRFRVLYRLGGRETSPKHGGSFPTKRLAEKRRDWIAGELANLRVPDLLLLEAEGSVVTLRAVAHEWRTSRVDVAAGTAQTHKVNLNRILPVLGDRPVMEIEPGEVAGLISQLHETGLKRESIRKTLATLAMVFDHVERLPNPARDKRVRLPQEDRAEVNPPTAAHVLAVHRLLPTRYRLPLLVLDATGMRVSELESLRWGDVDEPEGRWRVSQASAKTKQARWVPVPKVLFRRVVELVPREDRDLAGQVFGGFGADRFRTAITRACKAAGVPAYSPHDLRHRRASLWHLGGVPAAEAASWLGHSAQEHLRTYAHVVMDRTEIDYSTVASGGSRGASVFHISKMRPEEG
jgi:integrase